MCVLRLPLTLVTTWLVKALFRVTCRGVFVLTTTRVWAAVLFRLERCRLHDLVSVLLILLARRACLPAMVPGEMLVVLLLSGCARGRGRGRVVRLLSYVRVVPIVRLVSLVRCLTLTCRCREWLSLPDSDLRNALSLVSPGPPSIEVTACLTLVTVVPVSPLLTPLYVAHVSRLVSLCLCRRWLVRLPVSVHDRVALLYRCRVLRTCACSRVKQSLPMNLTIRRWLPTLRRLCPLDPTRLLVRIRCMVRLELLTLLMYRVLRCLESARLCS